MKIPIEFTLMLRSERLFGLHYEKTFILSKFCSIKSVVCSENGLLMILEMQVKFVFDFNQFPQCHYALKFYRKNKVTLSLVSI